jgi:hypothetical protein
VPIVLKFGSLNLLKPSGPVQACNGIGLPLSVKCVPLLRKDRSALKRYTLGTERLQYGSILEKIQGQLSSKDYQKRCHIRFKETKKKHSLVQCTGNKNS